MHSYDVRGYEVRGEKNLANFDRAFADSTDEEHVQGPPLYPSNACTYGCDMEVPNLTVCGTECHKVLFVDGNLDWDRDACGVNVGNDMGEPMYSYQSCYIRFPLSYLEVHVGVKKEEEGNAIPHTFKCSWYPQ